MAKSKSKEKAQQSSSNFQFNWDNELCAEHDGTIGSFERLTIKLDDIASYKSEVLHRDSINIAKAAKITGVAATGVLAIGAVAMTGGIAAAPAAALGKLGLLGVAGTGTSIATLSGAALTSASLAAIGGTVATGTVIVSAAGLGLGGVVGGVLGHRYLSDDATFDIKCLKKRKRVNTVFINGFLKQKDEKFLEWREGHEHYFDNEGLYGITWSSKELLEIGTALSKGIGNKTLLKILEEAAKKASKKAAPNLDIIGRMKLIVDILGNPWHVAMVNAGKAGANLADAISRSKTGKFTLVGHSLGCRVIYYALAALSTNDTRKIDDVILLGGAVGDDPKSWAAIAPAVDGQIYNCYSRNDKILDYLYRFANLGFSSPIGINPIKASRDKIVNIDCTQFVDSHFRWKEDYPRILETVFSEGYTVAG